jgi:FkbM family methyltransferase
MSDGAWIDLPNGFLVYTKKSDWNKNSIYKGQYERPLLHFLEHIKPSGLVIDIGANIGITLWSSTKAASREAHFLAFEPSPNCFNQLSKFALEREIACDFFPIALGGKETVLEMYGTTNQLNSGGATLSPHGFDETDRVAVNVSTLDRVLEDEKFAHKQISLIKIDTEGFEGEVLAGARKTLENNPPDTLVLEVSPMFGDISYLHYLWETLSPNFDFFEIGEVGSPKRKTQLRKIDLRDALETTAQINLAAIKRTLLPRFQKSRELKFI